MNSQSLLLALTLPLLAACSAAPPPPAEGPAPAPANAAPELAGRWVSDCVKVSEQQIMKLDFRIAKDTWDLDYTTYADAACQTKFLTVHIEGPYEIGQASATAQGAFNGKFGFTKKTVTPHIDAAAGFLGSEKGCGGKWVTGAAVDIGEKGCAGLGQRPVGACGADYDLVFTDGKLLTFGDRPADNDMCTEDKRPKALSKLSMKKAVE